MKFNVCCYGFKGVAIRFFTLHKLALCIDKNRIKEWGLNNRHPIN